MIGVIANPIAGRGLGEVRARELVAALEGLGCEVEVWFTAGPRDATRLARELPPEVDRVVAVGGDGTMRGVIAGLDLERVAAGMLPMGTANILAHELKLPRDPAGCARMVAEGATVPFDIGLAGGERFLMVAGVGFDAACARAVNEGRTGAIRMTTYIAPILRELGRFEHPHLTVRELDDDGNTVARHDDVLSIVIGNVRAYGGPFEVTSYAYHASGDLELVLIRGRRPLPTMATVMAGALARLAPLLPCVETRTVRRVEVEAPRPAPVQLDGDHAGFTPVRFELEPRRARILTPRGTP